MRWLGVLALVAGSGCGDQAPVEPCPALADGQCTRSRGGTCADATCGAIYVCQGDRTWRLDEVCAPRDAGPSDAADADASPLACGDAAFDASTSSGCGPDLELPDCPVEVAAGCPGAACTSGCETFFACTPSGWSETPVATCVDGGLVPAPR